MEIALHWVLIIAIIAVSVCSVTFSFKARRSSDARVRGLNTSLMNVCMGVMLMLLSLFFLLLYSGSTVKVIVSTLLIIIGLFNLFAGLRNHSVYRSMKG
ncbi:YtpI family protein [Paenibacillus methanolicus]|uniref:YtpI-like protein n=1 Tax=Paenibacillus methanolicus TaxID=582686 RepID=A0A5S5BVG6_9BACL|nr:YtpI family protein [Paenibacillus methanolicus]TYP71175.1 YtpI-like protein [Paenibacillus methanolicus]